MMVEFLRFIFKGRFEVLNLSIFETIKQVIFGYFKNIFLYIGIVSIFYFIGYSSGEKSPSVRRDNVPDFFKYLFICIVLPFMEELVFRLPLKPNKINLYISLLLLNVLFFLISRKYFYDIQYLRYIIFCLLLGISISVIYFKHEPIMVYIKDNLFVFIHISSVLFCLIHYWNFDFTNKAITPYLLMLLMLMNGYYFAYTRMKFGISYAIFIHAFHNILISFPLLLKLLK